MSRRTNTWGVRAALDVIAVPVLTAPRTEAGARRIVNGCTGRGDELSQRYARYLTLAGCGASCRHQRQHQHVRSRTAPALSRDRRSHILRSTKEPIRESACSRRRAARAQSLLNRRRAIGDRASRVEASRDSPRLVLPCATPSKQKRLAIKQEIGLLKSEICSQRDTFQPSSLKHWFGQGRIKHKPLHLVSAQQ